MRFPLAAFESFCAQLRIPSKERGLVPLAPLYGGQRYIVREIARGLEEDIHEFVILKGRQIGATTVCDALDLFWPQTYAGITGMLAADDEPNKKFRRDVIREMLRTLPKAYRYPVRADNDDLLAWANGSRLIFTAAQQRQAGAKTKLGRSRGVNYLHADEVGAWTNQRQVAGLRASMAEHHPRRLAIWPSTAQGWDVFRDLFVDAQTATKSRAIFVGPWLHEGYRIPQSETATWEAYGLDPPTADERLWLFAIKDRYDYEVPPEYVVWRRYQLAEKFSGDDDMLNQEFPNLPEDAFVSFGDKFVSPAIVRRLRHDLTRAPEPSTYRYEWGRVLDESRVIACEPERATLRVWEEPDPTGVYVVAAHPAYSSTQTARDDVLLVYRAYPDRLVQVAEYVVEGGGPTYQMAWACMHLVGAYRMARRTVDMYFILEIQMTGRAVLVEIERIQNLGYGLTQRLKERGREVQDLLGAVRHYCFVRPDTMTGTPALQWQTQPNYRPWLLNAMRDELDRGHLELRSEALVNELAALRRGESGDHDEIQGGGLTSECRAVATALAVEMWLKTAMPELMNYIAPKESEQPYVGAQLVGGFLHRLATQGKG